MDAGWASGTTDFHLSCSYRINSGVRPAASLHTQGLTPRRAGASKPEATLQAADAAGAGAGEAKRVHCLVMPYLAFSTTLTLVNKTHAEGNARYWPIVGREHFVSEPWKLPLLAFQSKLHQCEVTALGAASSDIASSHKHIHIIAQSPRILDAQRMVHSLT